MPLSPQITNQGLVSRTLPSANADSANNSVSARLARYGEQFAWAPAIGMYPFVDEGSFFIGRTPTPGTGVSSTIRTTFSDTVPIIVMNNSSSTKSAYLLSAKFIVTVAGASGTTWQMAVKIDTVNRAIGTNNMTAFTPVCPNGAGNTSAVSFSYQSSSTASAVTAASQSAFVAAEASLGGLSIVGDTYMLEFGQQVLAGIPGLTAAQATCPGVKVCSCPPAVIPPLGSAVFHFWGANIAITAMSYSTEVCWIER